MAMKIHYMWVGQGDCTIIETNAGQADGWIIMIDCGSVSGAEEVYNDNIKLSLEDIFATYPQVNGTARNTIDWLFLTHPDKDHYNMTTRIMRHFTIDRIIYSGPRREYNQTPTADGYLPDMLPDMPIIPHVFDVNARNSVIADPNTGFKLWILSANFPFESSSRDEDALDKFISDKKILDKNTNTLYYKRSDSTKNTKDVRAVLDANGLSLIILIEYGATFRAMFMGDATSYQQDKLMEKYIEAFNNNAIIDNIDGVGDIIPLVNLQSTVFKFSHHGSASSYNKDFVNHFVRPNATIASGGMKSNYYHPSSTIYNDASAYNHNFPSHQCVFYIDNIPAYLLGTKNIVHEGWYQDITVNKMQFTTLINFISIDDYNKLPNVKQLGDGGVMMYGRNKIFTVQPNGTFNIKDGRELYLHSKNELA